MRFEVQKSESKFQNVTLSMTLTCFVNQFLQPQNEK